MDQNYKLSSGILFEDALHVLFCKLNENINHYLNEFHQYTVGSVHEIRKTNMRLRALVKPVNPCLEEQNFEFLNMWYRDPGRILSDVRDAHNCAQILHDFTKTHEKNCPSGNYLILYKFQFNIFAVLHYLSELNEKIGKDILNEAAKLYSVSHRNFNQVIHITIPI